MPFDREGAKKAGYTDAEIDAYLGQPTAPDSAAVPQPAPLSMAERIVPLAVGGAALGGGALAAGAAVRNAPTAARAMGKFLAKRIPGAHTVMDAAELAKDLRGPQPQPQAAPAPPAAQAAPMQPAPAPTPPKASPGRSIITAADKAMHPEFAAFPEGAEIPNSAYLKVKMPTVYGSGSAASRVNARTTAQPASTSVSMSTAQEVPTVPGSVKVTSGRPSRPKLSVVEGKGGPGSAASRAAQASPPGPSTVADEPVADLAKVPKWQGGKMSEAGTRHDMQHWSESEAKHVDFEDMQQTRLLNTIKKLQTKLAGKTNPGETTVRSLENALVELKHRVSTGAITVGETPAAGSAAGRAARAAAAISEASGAETAALRPRAAGGALGGTMLGVAGYLPNLINPGQDFRDSQSYFDEANAKRLGLPRQTQSTGF